MENGKNGKGKKIKTFIVATNVVASRPTERRPTGTPHARANFETLGLNYRHLVREVFLFDILEVGVIIPLPVRIIPFLCVNQKC